MQKMSLENEELVLHLANSQDVQEQMREQISELQVSWKWISRIVVWSEYSVIIDVDLIDVMRTIGVICNF